MINDDILTRIDREYDEVYFYCGTYHIPSKSLVQKNALFFYKNFNRKPKKGYTFVFINHKAKSDAYSQLKEIFLHLPLEYFVHLDHFILVKPSFFHKAQDFIAFNVLPSYLKSRTTHVDSCKELCNLLKLKPQDLVDIIPEEIAQIDFPKLKPRKKKLPNQRMNFQGQIRDSREEKSQIEF